MTHLKSREIDNMSDEARQSRLVELREELLQLRAQQALGGSCLQLGCIQGNTPLDCSSFDENE